jgi:tetratricopeptide (TPR) repeat protein
LTPDQKGCVQEMAYETYVSLADTAVRWDPAPKDARAAVELLDRAQSFHEPTRAFWFVRGEAHRLLKDDLAAKEDDQHFQTAEAKSAWDYFLPGHTAGWHGDLPGALASYRAALRVQPDHFNSLFFLGKRLWENNRESEAIGYFIACNALHPDVNMRMNCGDCNYRMGHLEEAEADYSAAIKFAKTDALRLGAYQGRCEFYQDVGRADDAQRDLDRYIPLAKQVLESQRAALGPEHAQTLATIALLADALLRKQQYAEAEPLLRQCLTASERHQPDDWKTFNCKSLLGGALFGQAHGMKNSQAGAAEKKFSEAEPLLLTGYEGLKAHENEGTNEVKSRRSPEAMERLVKLYTELGKPDEAAKWQKKLDARKSDQLPSAKSQNPKPKA